MSVLRAGKVCRKSVVGSLLMRVTRTVLRYEPISAVENCSYSSMCGSDVYGECFSNLEFEYVLNSHKFQQNLI